MISSDTAGTAQRGTYLLAARIATYVGNLTLIIDNNCGPGSSVGMATDYGLDGPGSSPGWDEISTRPDRPWSPPSLL